MIKNALFLFFVCASLFLFYLPAYMRMQALNEKNIAFERKINDLERENTKFAEERRRLEEDPTYFERMAREKMGIIKDGEVIYKMVPEGGLNGAPVSAQAQELMKKEAPAVKKATPISKSTTKKTSTATKTAVQKTISQKNKTSATMSKSKTPKSTTVKSAVTKSVTTNSTVVQSKY